MLPYEGKALGTSEWTTINQGMIDDFARVSGDRNWIHVDLERARRELPQGKTIAHGQLTLSLITALGAQTLKIRRRGKGINYGLNKVRFVSPVLCDSRIRLHRSLEKAEPMHGAWRLTFSNVMEIEGEAKPAMVAESISMVYEEEADA
ncbi:MaoC family dehydratase [Allopusillimonas ginsengisoli]|nr:MaoC family dehydratase [Allopusillimonas ginsengisoli]